MIYLVDANILSEPTKLAPDPKVVEWLIANEGDFVVDSIVLGELLVGILALPGGRKRAQLEQWLEAVVQTIDCLPWDAAVSRRWARLVVDLRKKGHKLPLLDGMIAATALEHRLTVVTRNTRDFQKTRVKMVNPFDQRTDVDALFSGGRGEKVAIRSQQVIDFGLAKSCTGEGFDVVVAGDAGVPRHCALRQSRANRGTAVDVRSDIYSLGATLWFMLAGKPPFEGSLARIMSQHLSESPPFDKLPALPSVIVDLLRRMMEKDPDARQTKRSS